MFKVRSVFYAVSVPTKSTRALSLVAGDLNRTTFVPGRHNAFALAAQGEPCNPASSPSVSICAPVSASTANSPVQVEASAAVTGVFAHTQLWVDGVKKFTETSTALETSVILPAGHHRFAVVATNTAGQKWENCRLRNRPVTVTASFMQVSAGSPETVFLSRR